MMLELKNVTKTYTQGEARIEVLRGVDLSVATGETVSIVGPSGGGKSTLLSLLSGIDKPTSGSLRIEGNELVELSDDEMTIFRGKSYGIVFQQFHLIQHLTALENVMLPLEINSISNAQEIAQKYLGEVGLSPRIHHRPSQLSGGEIQRVAIARALATQPKLLLADEPSGNLDSKTGSQVMDLLFDLAKRHNTTMVLVTHSLELANRCQRRFALDAGRLKEL